MLKSLKKGDRATLHNILFFIITGIVACIVMVGAYFVVQENEERLLYFLIAGIVIIICMTLIFALKFAKQNKEIVEASPLEEHENIDDQDDIEYIKYVLEQTKKRLKEADEKLETHMSIVQNNFLMRAMNGMLSEDSFLSECEKIGINFEHDKYVVILFRIEEYSNLFFEENRDTKSSLKLVHLIIDNVVHEILSENYTCNIVESNEMMIAVLNMNETASQVALVDITEKAEKIQQFFDSEFCLFTSSAISSVHDGYEGLLKAYNEALKAYEYMHILGNKNYVVKYADIEFEKSNFISGTNSSHIEQQFSNCLRAGDFGKAREVMAEIFENNFLNTVTTIQMIKCRMFGLMNAMLNVIGTMNIDNSGAFIEELNITERLFGCETVIELQKEMNSIIDDIEGYSKENQANNYNQTKEDIIKYIDENYSHHDLSVAMIADEFGMNASYLSKFFKKQVGEGLLNYIHTVRIEKSKKLLEDPNYTVKEIAEMVGFYNSDAFIRTFKKVLGVTPGKYKELKDN